MYLQIRISTIMFSLFSGKKNLLEMDELGNTIEKLEICRLCLSLTVTKFNIFTDDFPKMIEMLTSIKVIECKNYK